MLVLTMSVGVSMLGGCGRDTPNCDRADDFVRKAQLSRAAQAFATGERRGEGRCALKGLEKVAKRRGQALASTAKGQAAETMGDLTEARLAFQSALDLDYGNGDAAAGLLRVTRRPSDTDRVWLPAKRLHDEGYDDAARTQIAAVLKAHPDLVVPQSLSSLSPSTVAAIPAPAAMGAWTVTPQTATTLSSSGGPATWAWWCVVLVLAGAAGAAGWILHRRTRATEADAAQLRAELFRTRQILESLIAATSWPRGELTVPPTDPARTPAPDEIRT